MWPHISSLLVSPFHNHLPSSDFLHLIATGLKRGFSTKASAISRSEYTRLPSCTEVHSVGTIVLAKNPSVLVTSCKSFRNRKAFVAFVFASSLLVTAKRKLSIAR